MMTKLLKKFGSNYLIKKIGSNYLIKYKCFGEVSSFHGFMKMTTVPSFS